MELPIDDVPLGLDIKRKKSDQTNAQKQKAGEKLLQAKRYRKEHRVKITLAGDAVKTTDLPAPVEEFSKLAIKPYKFHSTLLENLQKLEYSTPTPVQAQTIPVMLKHYNLLAGAPTGSGKTAAYLLPILNEYMRFVDSSPEWHTAASASDGDSQTQQQQQKHHKIQLFGLILAPTQELVRQIWSEAMRLSLGLSGKHFMACLKRKHYANRGKKNKTSMKTPPMKQKEAPGGEQTEKEKNEAKHTRRIRELRLPCSTRILVATPCRMGALLSLGPSECPFDISRLSWLVIDECDKMLQVDLTHSGASGASRKPRRPRSFRDQMAPIFRAFSTPPNDQQTQQIVTVSPHVALFSATIPDEVTQWAREELSHQLVSSHASGDASDPEKQLIELRIGKRDSAVSTVSQELRYCATEEGKLLEMRCLLIRGLAYPCLIFMESRERAKELVKEILLSDTDVLANVISSDKTEAQRAAVIRAFREGQINVLVCTDLLGRGIDFKGVIMVVNYDLPPSKEEYIHRVGRTGRAGHRGRAITLWTDADLPYLSDILKVMRRSGSEVDPELERLVDDWHKRRAQMVLAKRKRLDAAADARIPHGVIISRRRGERRLVHELLHQNPTDAQGATTREEGKKAAEDPASGKSLKWLRRWNPYRRPIHDLAGARATRPAYEDTDSVQPGKAKKRRKPAH